MLNLTVTISGDKVVIAGLQSIAAELPKAVQRGLSRVAKGVHRAAFDLLSGPGRKPMNSGSRLRGQMDYLGARPGSYPVPIITGNLRRLLDWVPPGATKTSGGKSFTAGPMAAIVYDSALYSRIIHEGRGSSAKFGTRPFLSDAFKRFNEGAGAAKAIEIEIQTAIDKRG